MTVTLVGGTIINGTGSVPPHGGNVIIHDGMIREVGNVAPVGRVVDVTGLVVAPGSIDIHSHAPRCDEQVEKQLIRQHPALAAGIGEGAAFDVCEPRCFGCRHGHQVEADFLQWVPGGAVRAQGGQCGTAWSISRAHLLNDGYGGTVDDRLLVERLLARGDAMVGTDTLPLRAASGRIHVEQAMFWGTIPRFLGTYVRDAGFTSMTDAVRRLTSAVADRVGLRRRGRLRPSHFAYIVVFDDTTINDSGSNLAASRPASNTSSSMVSP